MSETIVQPTTGIVEAGIRRRGLLKAAAGLALGGALAERAMPTVADRKRRAAGQAGIQEGWRYCNKCRALHSVWDGARGACPAGGQHNVQDSFNYQLYYGDVPSLQGGWRYCRKCRALHSDWDGNRGPCPAGGQHSVETSLAYRVFTNSFPNPDLGGGYGLQGDWRYCKKCRVLHSVWDGARGTCASGGQHSVDTSLKYQVLYRR